MNNNRVHLNILKTVALLSVAGRLAPVTWSTGSYVGCLPPSPVYFILRSTTPSAFFFFNRAEPRNVSLMTFPCHIGFNIIDHDSFVTV